MNGEPRARAGDGPERMRDRTERIGESAARSWFGLRELARGYATLAVLDAQRAGLTLARAAAATLVIAVLAISAWLALLAGIVVLFAGDRISLPAMFFIVAVLNLILAAGVAAWARALYAERPFAATLRHLRRNHEAIPGDADAPAAQPR